MPSSLPVYNLQTLPHYLPETLFYMTRLETLVQEVEETDKPHSHTFYLVMWIKAGSGTHTIDGRTYPIAPNQLYFVTPGKVHNWQLSDDIKGYNLFFDSTFCRGQYGHFLYAYPFFHSKKHLPILEVTDPDALFDPIFDFIYKEYEDNLVNRYEVIQSSLHIILELADRSYNARWTGTDSYRYDRIRQYEQLIEHQFLTVREVSAYAAQMNLTPHYLNQICKKVVGKTASQLLQERMILEAKFLLTHTNNSVKEIGFRLGFQDPSYFVRFFKKNTGETPANFRQYHLDKH